MVEHGAEKDGEPSVEKEGEHRSMAPEHGGVEHGAEKEGEPSVEKEHGTGARHRTTRGGDGARHRSTAWRRDGGTGTAWSWAAWRRRFFLRLLGRNCVEQRSGKI